MNRLKRISLLAVAAMISVNVCGCGEKAPSRYDMSETVLALKSQTVEENGNLRLSWDDTTKSVRMTVLATGQEWSNIPVDVIEAGSTSANLNSTINIEVFKEGATSSDEIKGYTGAFEKGRISAEKIENGIKVTYYFDEYMVSVPVEYTLRENSVAACINTKGIVEDDEYRLLSVELAPYMTSVQNETDGAYLFVPAGSGSLLYAATTVEGTRSFMCNVYGEDMAELVTVSSEKYATAPLPVFGAKSGDAALCGIIEQGAECVRLKSESGNSRTKHSCVYPKIYVRSMDRLETTVNQLVSNDVFMKSEKIVDGTICVGYYPLSGENADYIGMAKTYRAYLEDHHELKTANSGSGNYGVTLYGGAESTTTVLGFPTKKLNVMTTFDAAKTVVSALTEEVEAPSDVRLYGYGNRGVSPGKVAGGFSFPAVFGGKKEYKALENFCQNKQINLYTDFDTVRYSQSGNGFSTLGDSAKSATLRKVRRSLANVPLGESNKEYSYYLVKRNLMDKITDKLLSFANKTGISGISMTQLGSVAYSDHHKAEYAVKYGMANDAIRQITAVSDAGHRVAVGQANAYAAAVADVIYDVPTNNGNYAVLDESVPFYQLVFAGSKDLYSPSINLATNPDEQLMLCAAYGMKPSFALIGDYISDVMEINVERFNSMLYSDNLSLIKQSMKKLGSLTDAISGQRIESYACLSDSLFKTVYENGVTVITNHSDRECVYNGMTISAYGIVWEGGTAQ